MIAATCPFQRALLPAALLAVAGATPAQGRAALRVDRPTAAKP